MQQRTGHAAIDGRGDTTSACQVDSELVDGEVEIRAPEDGTVGSNTGARVGVPGHAGVSVNPRAARGAPNDSTRGEHAACGHTLHEPTS